MNLNELKTFCSDWRPLLEEPWSDMGFSFASDGMILVRIPEIAGATSHQNNLSKLWNYLVASPRMVSLPPLLEVKAKLECDICRGSGISKCSCSHCQGHECECMEKSANFMIIGTRRLRLDLLSKIAALPNLKIQMDGGEESPAKFTFDGGDGLIMPMRKELKCAI